MFSVVSVSFRPFIGGIPVRVLAAVPTPPYRAPATPQTCLNLVNLDLTVRGPPSFPEHVQTCSLYEVWTVGKWAVSI